MTYQNDDIKQAIIDAGGIYKRDLDVELEYANADFSITTPSSNSSAVLSDFRISMTLIQFFDAGDICINSPLIF